jgi:hypothetical protein
VTGFARSPRLVTFSKGEGQTIAVVLGDRNSERHGRDWQRCAFKTAVKECAALIRSGAEGMTSAIADLFDVNYAPLDIA